MECSQRHVAAAMITTRRFAATISLAGAFVYDIVIASLSVASIALRPHRVHRPAIVAVPVEARTRWGVALFAYLVSLTPGSTCLHVAEDLKTLYVHFLDAPDPAARGAEMKSLYEKRIIRMEGGDVETAP
jgi:multicomponent Na+:H+ antiporter subunit E